MGMTRCSPSRSSLPESISGPTHARARVWDGSSRTPTSGPYEATRSPNSSAATGEAHRWRPARHALTPRPRPCPRAGLSDASLLRPGAVRHPAPWRRRPRSRPSIHRRHRRSADAGRASPRPDPGDRSPANAHRHRLQDRADRDEIHGGVVVQGPDMPRSRGGGGAQLLDLLEFFFTHRQFHRSLASQVPSDSDTPRLRSPFAAASRTSPLPEASKPHNASSASGPGVRRRAQTALTPMALLSS